MPPLNVCSESHCACLFFLSSLVVICVCIPSDLVYLGDDRHLGDFCISCRPLVAVKFHCCLLRSQTRQRRLQGCPCLPPLPGDPSYLGGDRHLDDFCISCRPRVVVEFHCCLLRVSLLRSVFSCCAKTLSSSRRVRSAATIGSGARWTACFIVKACIQYLTSFILPFIPML
eukprot:COSAG02_NODE_10990_length_1816_cov_1.668608_2_plen_171_part_00